MIAVNGELDDVPFIKQNVHQLDAQGLLHYIELADFFAGLTDYDSPEDHRWGTTAHRILGERLSELITQLDRERG